MSKIKIFEKTDDNKIHVAEGNKKIGDIAEDSIGKYLRQRAEKYLRKRPKELGGKAGQDVDNLIHDLCAYQLELEKQNDELRETRQKLEQSRRRLTDLYDFAPVGCFTCDTQGVIVSVNLTGAEMLGMAKSQLDHVPFSAFIHPDDDEKFHNYFRKIKEGKGKQASVFKLSKNNGSQLYVQLESIPVQNDTNTVTEIRTTATDISDRMKTEVKLQDKSLLLRTIIDTTDVLLVYLDLDFNFIWVNPPYARECKMAPEEITGKNLFDLYPNKENEEIFCQVRDSGKAIFFKDKPFEYPDQPERGITYWDWSLSPVKDTNDQVSALVLSLRETTQYKKAEIDLARSEKLYRLITDNSTDIIFQLDPSGRLSYISPAIRLFGYNPEELIGSYFIEFIQEQEVLKAERAWQKVVTGEEVTLLELGIRKKDGTMAACEIQATPIISQNKGVSIQGIARDITSRKYMEDSLRKSEAQLHTTLDNLAEGVIVADLDGKLIYWNPIAVKMHGFTSAEEYLLNLPAFKDTFELSTPEEGILPLEKWPLSRILNGETIDEYEIDIWRRDTDMRRIYNYGGALARDSEGNPLMAILTITDITNHKRTEATIKRSNSLLRGINSIFEASLGCENDQQLAAETLRITEQITGSRFGFIGEIVSDGSLQVIAINDPGWEQSTMQDKTGLRNPPDNFKISGLFGHAISQRVSFFTNAPSSHSESINIPDGHPPLTCFLGVPLFYGNQIIGMIAQANREGGYSDDDIESVESLAKAFVEALFKCRTERALKESETRERNNAKLFKQFLDFTPIPVWTAHDSECQVITSNRAAAKLLGVEPDKNISLSAGSEDKPPQIRLFRNGIELDTDEMPIHYAVRKGVPVDDVEMDIITTDNKKIRMIGAAAPLYDTDGKVKGGIGAFLDITERKSLEQQLIRAKKEWEKTFDAVPDLIAILDPHHQIVRANKAMADKLHMTPAQCVGLHCFECIHSESQPIVECPNVLTLKDGKEHTAIVHEERFGGDFLVTTTPFFDDDGETLATVHVARDITALKETERLLLASEKRLKSAQKLARLGSWELDTINNVLYWSDEVFRMFGFKPQSFEPCYEDFIEMVHPDDRQKVNDAYIDSIRSEKNGYELDHRIVHKYSGKIHYFHEKCEHVRDETGKVIRSEGMVHDITERKLAEEQILSLNKDLQKSIRDLALLNQEYERSNHDLQQYAYIISHDLQEPLRTVSSFVQLLSRRYKGKLDEKADTFINFAVEGTAHMQRLLQDLLQFSRVGGGELRLKPISLESVIQKSLLHLKSSIDETEAEITWDNVPSINVDEGQLSLLVQNLISNALKFRDKDTPRINISAEKGNDEWVICVRDNGIGIDPKFSERIFLLFQRLHGRNEFAGTGLGLAICKKVVQRHGGRIWVESTPGEGSAFYFSLPTKSE